MMRGNRVGALVIGLVAVCATTTLRASGHDARVADAAMRRDVDAVRALLKQGADVNAAQGDGKTALHWAAERGDLDLAALLLQAGASAAATTRVGQQTPLHLAAGAGRAAVVEALVAAGAKTNALSRTGVTPLHLAASSGSRDAAKILVEHGADVNAREPQWGQTPLMFAAGYGRASVVTELLTHGADARLTGKVVDISARSIEDSADSRQRNARLAAARRNATSAAPEGARGAPAAEPVRDAASAAADAAASRLVDLNEEPEPLGYADLVGAHGGLSALLLAAREGHTDTVHALLASGADINQPSASDRTSPLLMAAINGHFDLAKDLLARGADPRQESIAGGTPLYGVINMQWIPKARHPQPADYMQQQVGYLELAEALLQAGADPNARLRKSLWFTTYNRDMLGVNRTGATAFWRAAHALDVPAMRLLLKYGADPNLSTSRVPERFEDGPEQGGVNRSGLPPTPFGGPAVAAIHAASGVGHGLGFAGNTHRHVPDGWLPAVKFLVEELGADVNARDHNGYTPLHHAASRGDNDLITYLVSKGADPKVASRSGQTTVDMANGPVQRIQPFPETIALLESLGARNNHRCVSC